jgi:hypothetical protein
MTSKTWGMCGGAAVLLAVGLLAGCGTASSDSKYQAQHGVSPVNDYPAGNPKDAGSPALASSTETKYSRDQAEKEEPSKVDSTSKK